MTGGKDHQPLPPVVQVVGFHVEGASPSPNLLSNVLVGGGMTAGSPTPVIIPPSFQVRRKQRAAAAGVPSPSWLLHAGLHVVRMACVPAALDSIRACPASACVCPCCCTSVPRAARVVEQQQDSPRCCHRPHGEPGRWWIALALVVAMQIIYRGWGNGRANVPRW